MDNIEKKIDDEMRIKELLGALEDARTMKASLEKELDHRVSNNLQLMTSIVRLELSASAEASAIKALSDTERRLHALSVTNRQFLNRLDADRFELYSFMYDVTTDLHALYDPDLQSLSVSLRGARIYLAMRLIDPLGIITGEIVSNALVRARAGGRPIRLDISWEVDEQGLLSLSYCDTGGGFPEEIPDSGESLGMIIIRALAEQMRAKLSAANGSIGAVITFTVYVR